MDAKGDGVGVAYLVGQLNPVLVEPATGNDLHAVEAGNVGAREKGRQDVAHQSADAVHSKDVQCVVDMHEKLEFGGVVGKDGAEDANGHGGPRRDKTCSRS